MKSHLFCRHDARVKMIISIVNILSVIIMPHNVWELKEVRDLKPKTF